MKIYNLQILKSPCTPPSESRIGCRNPRVRKLLLACCGSQRPHCEKAQCRAADVSSGDPRARKRPLKSRSCQANFTSFRDKWTGQGAEDEGSFRSTFSLEEGRRNKRSWDIQVLASESHLGAGHLLTCLNDRCGSASVLQPP